MPINKTYEDFTLPATGVTKSFDVAEAIDIYNLIPAGGSIILTGNIIINSTGTPVENQTFRFNYGGQATIGAFNVTIFGAVMTSAQALAPSIVECQYLNSAWEVKIFMVGDGTTGDYINGADIVESSIPNSKIATDTLSVNKLANSTRGYIIRAVTGGIHQTYDASTADYFLRGDGTDITSAPITGDIAVSGGVASIQNGVLEPIMFANTPSFYHEASLVITSAQVKALNTTPQTIIPSPGAGFTIEIISASASMAFGATPYATATTLQLINDGADVAQLDNTSLLISSVDKNLVKFTDATEPTAGQTQGINATAIEVSVATADPTAGDSDITVNVIYRIIEV